MGVRSLLSLLTTDLFPLLSLLFVPRLELLSATNSTPTSSHNVYKKLFTAFQLDLASV
jgi:hypothetical protein